MKFIIDSDLSQQREIQKRILDAVEAAGFSSDNLFAVKISLEEALINAIKHGNKLDPNKKVHVEASRHPAMKPRSSSKTKARVLIARMFPIRPPRKIS